MKIRTVLFLAALSIAFTTLACGGATEVAMQGTAEDEAAVRSLADKYVAAFNADDAAGIAALVTDDYRAVAPDGTMVSGKTGVERIEGAEMQMIQKNATIGGTWTVEGVPEGEPDQGSWLAVVRKSPDGQWLPTHSSASPPPVHAFSGIRIRRKPSGTALPPTKSS